jgi:hypothetical protein
MHTERHRLTRMGPGVGVQSIGGNDVFGFYSAYNGSAAMPAIEASLRTILDGLVAVHPGVQLVMAGYDLYVLRQADCNVPGGCVYPDPHCPAICLSVCVCACVCERASVNFEQSPACIAQALAVFHGLGTPEINLIFLQLGDVQARVAADYANVTYVPLWGSLQIADGMSPTHLRPSPAKYFSDCIHLNDDGWNIFMGNLYDAYWKPQLDP